MRGYFKLAGNCKPRTPPSPPPPPSPSPPLPPPSVIVREIGKNEAKIAKEIKENSSNGKQCGGKFYRKQKNNTE